MSSELRNHIANLVSNFLNPFVVALAVIILLSLQSTSSITDAIKWSSILVAASILPVFLVVGYLAHNKRIDGIFASVRGQRTKIYLLAVVCVAIGGVVIVHFRAPLLLLSAFVSGLSAIVIFMGINLFWKISVHTAFISALITVLVILYGFIAAVTAVLLPLTAWARIELEHHSVAQTTTGALLAALIVVVVFYSFGLI